MSRLSVVPETEGYILRKKEIDIKEYQALSSTQVEEEGSTLPWREQSASFNTGTARSNSPMSSGSSNFPHERISISLTLSTDDIELSSGAWSSGRSSGMY